MSIPDGDFADEDGRRQQQAEPSTDSSARVTAFLSQAGLAESTIDPLSLAALEELLPTVESVKNSSGLLPLDDEHAVFPAATESLDPIPGAGTNIPSLSTPSTRSLAGVGATPSHPSLSTPTMTKSLVNTNNHGTPNDPPITTTEQLILETLEYQTQLLLKLHQRVEKLSQRNPLQSQGDASVKAIECESEQASTTVPVTPPNDQPPPQPRGGAARRPLVIRRNQRNRRPNVGEQWGQTRIYRLTRLLVGLYRQRVQELDMGLMLKMLVMVAILIARIQGSRHRRHQETPEETSWLWMYRFYFSSFFIVVAFLYQTGFLSFVYWFVVKEKYVTRILLDAEDLDVDAELVRQQQRPEPPRPVPRDAEPQPNAEGANNDVHENREGPVGGAVRDGDWQNTVFGGRIAPPGQGVIGVAQDIGYLLITFFLSIFPMWQPERPPQPVENRADPEADELPQDIQQPENGPGELPQVRDPVNPVESESESEIEDDSD
jgi:hypothetical protein